MGFNWVLFSLRGFIMVEPVFPMFFLSSTRCYRVLYLRRLEGLECGRCQSIGLKCFVSFFSSSSVTFEKNRIPSTVGAADRHNWQLLTSWNHLWARLISLSQAVYLWRAWRPFFIGCTSFFYQFIQSFLCFEELFLDSTGSSTGWMRCH